MSACARLSIVIIISYHSDFVGTEKLLYAASILCGNATMVSLQCNNNGITKLRPSNYINPVHLHASKWKMNSDLGRDIIITEILAH